MTPSPLWDRTTISGLRALDDPAGHRFALSLVDPDWPAITQFDGWPASRRLELRFYDEIAPRNGRDPPDAAIMARILSFGADIARDTDGDARLFIHCLSGISRSTAAAVALWARAHPEAPSALLFSHLARLRPQAWPNSRLLAQADALLRRKDPLLAGAAGFFRARLEADATLRERMTRLRRERDIQAALG